MQSINFSFWKIIHSSRKKYKTNTAYFIKLSLLYRKDPFSPLVSQGKKSATLDESDLRNTK